MTHRIDDRTWLFLEKLCQSHPIRIDRPKDSVHPRHTDPVYPLDYGYLEGTQSGDGDGIDIWLGSSDRKEITGIVLTVDIIKKDIEVKILLGCDEVEADQILAFLNGKTMSAQLFLRKESKDD